MTTVYVPGAAISLSGRTLRASLLACVTLCCVAVHSSAWAEAYPAPGRPDPGAPCAQRGGPARWAFVCKFMTVDLWRAAGRPEFTAPDGTHWRPWFYGDVSDSGNNLLYEGFGFRRRNEGLLEAMQKTGDLPDQYDPAYVSRYWSLFRYTPWSVHFQRELGCSAAQAANPYALAGGGTDRSQLLGMGWAGVAGDADDPTGALAKGTLPVMLTLANIDTLIPVRGNGKHDTSVRDVINALARGESGVRPDYDRDGEVWLVKPKGPGKRLDDLDAAAAEAARTRRLFVNGPAQTWRQGSIAAAARARSLGGALIYVYFARDPLRPGGTDKVFARRLRYVAGHAGRRAVGDHARIVLYSPGGGEAFAAPVAGLHGVVVRRGDLWSLTARAAAGHGAAPRRCTGIASPPFADRPLH